VPRADTRHAHGRMYPCRVMSLLVLGPDMLNRVFVWRSVSQGAAGGLRRRRGGVPERVRGVRAGPPLLQQRLRDATTFHATAYSSVFKSACPRAYSYAYDDSSIAFCLPPSGPDAIPLGSPPANVPSTAAA